MNKDLTIGKPETVLWQFCLPLFGSILFQQLYNISDSLIAGKFIGENALAAVGNGYEITLIFIAFATGSNIGCSVIVSQLFGAKNYGSMKTAVYTAFLAIIILCAILMLLGLLCGRWLLNFINTPDIIFADSLLYLNIYILGLPFMLLYNISTGIFSAMGDSKTPFIFLALSSVTNIFVNILLVTAFKMGVAGVALATFLCQGVSCILAMIVVIRRLATLPATKQTPLFSWHLLRKIASVALPSILQQSFISVGNLFVQGVINNFGPGVIAGYSAAIKLNSLAITSFTTIGSGISNYTAQNIGAGKWKRLSKGFIAGTKMIWTLCLPLVFLYFLVGPLLMRFFINQPSPEALSTGAQFLRIVSPFYFVISVKFIIDGILRGAQLMKEFMLATFANLILRVVLALLVAEPIGPIGVWWAWPIGWCLAAGISLYFYRSRISSKTLPNTTE